MAETANVHVPTQGKRHAPNKQTKNTSLLTTANTCAAPLSHLQDHPLPPLLVGAELVRQPFTGGVAVGEGFRGPSRLVIVSVIALKVTLGTPLIDVTIGERYVCYCGKPAKATINIVFRITVDSNTRRALFETVINLRALLNAGQ